MAPAKPAAPRTEILDRGTLVFTAPGAGFGESLGKAQYILFRHPGPDRDADGAGGIALIHPHRAQHPAGPHLAR